MRNMWHVTCILLWCPAKPATAHASCRDAQPSRPLPMHELHARGQGNMRLSCNMHVVWLLCPGAPLLTRMHRMHQVSTCFFPKALLWVCATPSILKLSPSTGLSCWGPDALPVSDAQWSYPRSCCLGLDAHRSIHAHCHHPKSYFAWSEKARASRRRGASAECERKCLRLCPIMNVH